VSSRPSILPQTARFELYLKDNSLRGKKRRLAQILQSLASDSQYSEFADLLLLFRNELLFVDRDLDENLQRVKNSLQKHPLTLYEIAYDTDFSTSRAKFLLKLLMAQNIVKLKQVMNHQVYYLAD
jgi:hypothetical protein